MNTTIDGPNLGGKNNSNEKWNHQNVKVSTDEKSLIILYRNNQNVFTGLNGCISLYRIFDLSVRVCI